MGGAGSGSPEARVRADGRKATDTECRRRRATRWPLQAGEHGFGGDRFTRANAGFGGDHFSRANAGFGSDPVLISREGANKGAKTRSRRKRERPAGAGPY